MNDADDQPPDTSASSPDSKIFWRLTCAYVIAVLLGALVFGYFDPNGTFLDPADWGDVLAGVFSPLAFLWLVYTALSQRAELELQRIELRRNNQAQEEQRDALTRQAEALAAQVGLMTMQSDELRAARELATTEASVWRQWYLTDLQKVHDELINYTAHLRRDKPNLSDLNVVEQAFRMDTLQAGLLRVEAGVPKVHHLPSPTQSAVLNLLADIATHRRVTSDLIYRMRENGRASDEDFQHFFTVTDRLASSAHNAATSGFTLLREADGAQSKSARS